MSLDNKKIISFGNKNELEQLLIETFRFRDNIERKELSKRHKKDFLLANLDGILFFLEKIKLITVDSKSIRQINKDKWNFNDNLEINLLNLIIEELRKSGILNHFLYKDLLKIEDEKIVLDPVRVLAEYTALKNLFIEFKFFIHRPDNRFLEFSPLLSDRVLEYIPSPRPYIKKSKSQKELERELEKKNKYLKKLGDEAEIWVLEYEKNRLKDKVSNGLLESIERISQENVSAGFDILSLVNEQSKFPNKFIEVKSFGKDKIFYWTPNEIKVSREKADSYFLYLVDRHQMSEINYEPIQIQNPAKKILNGKYLEEELVFINNEETFKVNADNYKIEFQNV